MLQTKTTMVVFHIGIFWRIDVMLNVNVANKDNNE
jgi:hypothetical protein